jgi:hypothetical protein
LRKEIKDENSIEIFFLMFFSAHARELFMALVERVQRVVFSTTEIPQRSFRLIYDHNNDNSRIFSLIHTDSARRIN